MHFYYLDEAGCNGRDLSNPEQPIFVAGGIIIRDEGWNETNQQFCQIISSYFNNNVPPRFELHAAELLAPDGSGFFAGHPRENRNRLVDDILCLVHNRSHQVAYVALNKSALHRFDTSGIRNKDYLDLKVPYLIAYDYMLSIYEWFTKERLGRSARALAIIDEKDEFAHEIEQITQYRRYELPAAKRIKRITEFTYAINSRKNPMVQVSDMICFLIKKFLEIDAGYRNTYAPEVKSIFRGFYQRIDRRLIKKSILVESGRGMQDYNDFLSAVCILPRPNWRAIIYE